MRVEDRHEPEVRTEDRSTQVYTGLTGSVGSTWLGSIVTVSLGAYRLIREIGRGAMATVYLAREIESAEEVAIKILRHDAPDAVQRCFRGANAIHGLRHEHIVQVYEFGEIDGRPFVLMEYVDGRDLEQILRKEGPLAWEQASAIVHNLALALEFLHAREVVHRDVKPANCLLSHAGDVKISDFGIARPIVSSDQDPITGITTLVGTQKYIAPEVRGGATPTVRADIYALGATFVKLITGRVPDPRYGAQTELRGVPETIAPVVRKMLASEFDRYSSMRQVSEALARVLARRRSEGAQKGHADEAAAASASHEVAAESHDVLTPEQHTPTRSVDRHEETSNGEASSAWAARRSIPWARVGLQLGILACTAILTQIVWFRYEPAPGATPPAHIRALPKPAPPPATRPPHIRAPPKSAPRPPPIPNMETTGTGKEDPEGAEKHLIPEENPPAGVTPGGSKPAETPKTTAGTGTKPRRDPARRGRARKDWNTISRHANFRQCVKFLPTGKSVTLTFKISAAGLITSTRVLSKHLDATKQKKLNRCFRAYLVDKHELTLSRGDSPRTLRRTYEGL